MFDTDYEKDDKKEEIKRKALIGLGILLLVVSAFFVFKMIYKNAAKDSYKKLIADKSKEIVYQSTASIVKETDMVPVINIDNAAIKDINDEILDFYDDYLAMNPNNFTYEYNVSDNILSIIMKAKERYTDSETESIVFKSYNIDLKTFDVLNNEQLFKKFGVTQDKVQYFIAYQFLNYYNDLAQKKYLNKKECNFDCFIESTGIGDYVNDNHYYINNGHLEVYKFFNIFNDYNGVNYFDENSFHFIIK